MRKPDLGVSDQVPHKPGCIATEDGQRLEISIVLSAARFHSKTGFLMIRLISVRGDNILCHYILNLHSLNNDYS